MSAAAKDFPSVNPSTDRYLELTNPYSTELRPGLGPTVVPQRQLSPLWHTSEEIMDAVIRAQEDHNSEPPPVTVAACGGVRGETFLRELENSGDSADRAKAKAIRAGVDWRDMIGDYLHDDLYADRLLLNTGRPPLPLLPGGREYTVDDLRQHEAERRYFGGAEAMARIHHEKQVVDLDRERIRRAGEADRTVILHSADRGDDDHGVFTQPLPVPAMCSPLRAARLYYADPRVGTELTTCWFCHEDRDQIDALMMISCDPTTRALPTCATCERYFSDRLGHGVDFLKVSYRRFFQLGMPSDEYLVGEYRNLLLNGDRS